MAKKPPGAPAPDAPRATAPRATVKPRKAPAKAPVKADGEEDMALILAGMAAKELKQAGVFKNLFAPASKVIGENWAKNLEAHYERKREENTQRHFERVKEVETVMPPDEGPTERQAEAIFEWIDGAGKIDPDLEPELAAFWQSLLADIYNNDPLTEDIRPILRSMTRGDARMLLSLLPNSTRVTLEPPYLQRFLGWGIIDKPNISDRIRGATIIGVGSVFMALLFQSIPYPSLYGKIPEAVIPLVAIALGAGGALGGVFAVLNALNHYTLSPLGKTLVRDARKYAKRVTNDKPEPTQKPSASEDNVTSPVPEEEHSKPQTK